jgi:hypothetical protein
MNIINTKYGSFEIVDNNNGGTSLFIGGAKICEFPKIAWWNVDGLLIAIEQHHEVIEKRVKERVKEVEVTRENAADVLAQLIEVFGNEQKGFYASRLRQCLNKVVAA